MKPAGPFVPTASGTMRFSMAGDDCSLHFDLSQLTDKQQADHHANQVLTAMLQVALLYIAKDQDEVCLYDTFTSAPWCAALERYHRMFSTLGLTPLPMERIQYHPVEGFYESVADHPSDCELENLYMVSGSNFPVHQNPAALTISRNLNSKVHFAEHAPKFGLPVPDTLHCTKATLDSEEVRVFFRRHELPLMLKTLGLAGARNVTTVESLEQALDYLAEYDDQMQVILQQRLDTRDYTEMTVDLCVSDDSIAVTNVRQILFEDGLWVGNLLGGTVSLPAHHEQALLKVGEYAREHGFTSPQGFNLGIDYFVRNPQANPQLEELIITEINARWTGGLFPVELVRRLGVDHESVVAFIDMCPDSQFDAYQDFLERHLYNPQTPSTFAIAPMGFAPFPADPGGELAGIDCLFVWQIVIGDFEAFNEAKELWGRRKVPE